MSGETIFFDLDGTLIDPIEGITRSIQYALEEMGMEDIPTQSELTWCIGPPLWDTFPVLLGPRGDVEEAIGHYRERFTEEGLYEAEVYDGVGEMMMAFRDAEVPMYIATSKPHVYANTIAEHFGLMTFMDGLFGSELDGTNGDKTQLLQYALDETGADPAKCLMIGDRKFDIMGAQNNDIRSIGALWGYGDDGELHYAEAEALAGHPEELPEIAFEMLGLE